MNSKKILTGLGKLSGVSRNGPQNPILVLVLVLSAPIIAASASFSLSLLPVILVRVDSESSAPPVNQWSLEGLNGVMAFTVNG